MSLIQLTYTSTLFDDDPAAQAAIFNTSQTNNRSRNVTGMLLYARGIVLQVLEGENGQVSKTFRAIEQDARHRNVFVLSRQVVADRQFESWAMGFRQLTEMELGDHSIASQIFKTSSDEVVHRVKPGAALLILAYFADCVEVHS
jgi:hypothetical protein